MFTQAHHTHHCQTPYTRQSHSHGPACRLPCFLLRRESVKIVHLCNSVGLNPQKQVAMDHRSQILLLDFTCHMENTDNLTMVN